MTEPMLTCRELVELITDYLEGALAEAENRRFEDHLAVCKGCYTYLEQMRQTVWLVGKVTEDDLDEASKEELLRVFFAWKNKTDLCIG